MSRWIFSKFFGRLDWVFSMFCRTCHGEFSRNFIGRFKTDYPIYCRPFHDDVSRYCVRRLTMSFLDFCRASRRELSPYYVGHRTMYFPRYIVAVLWWISSLFCGNTRDENTGCSVRSLTVILMWPIVVLSGRYWPFRTDEFLLCRIHIQYFFAFKSFMTSSFEALISLNLLEPEFYI